MSVLYSSPSTKAMIILLLVVCCSIVRAIWRPSSEYVDNNIVNVYLVKWSWGWSLLCIVPTLVVTSMLYHGGRLTPVMFQFGRVLVAHSIWYVNTAVMFHIVNRNTGSCSNDSYGDYGSCRWHGYQWEGFDISGHVFLLTYCVLVITEEFTSTESVYLYSYYDSVLRVAHGKGHISDDRLAFLRSIRSVVHWLMMMLKFMAVLEIVIWLSMIVMTSLYYHTVLEKMVGYVMGVVHWYITYRVTYVHTSLSTRSGDFNPLSFSNH